MDTVKVFKDSTGEFRWNRRSENGEVISDSGEGYTNEKDCMDMAIMANGEGVRYVPYDPDAS